MSEQHLVQKDSSGSVFGGLSLVAWIIPIIGIPIAVIGLVKSSKNDDTLGLVLSIFGFLLAAFNSFAGFMMSL
jgi:hypothetical protein